MSVPRVEWCHFELPSVWEPDGLGLFTGHYRAATREEATEMIRNTAIGATLRRGPLRLTA